MLAILAELRALVALHGGQPGPELAPLTDAPLVELMRLRRSPEEQTQTLTRALRRVLIGDR